MVQARSARVVAALSRLEGLDGFVEEEFNLQTPLGGRATTGGHRGGRRHVRAVSSRMWWTKWGMKVSGDVCKSVCFDVMSGQHEL